MFPAQMLSIHESRALPFCSQSRAPDLALMVCCSLASDRKFQNGIQQGTYEGTG